MDFGDWKVLKSVWLVGSSVNLWGASVVSIECVIVVFGEIWEFEWTVDGCDRNCVWVELDKMKSGRRLVRYLAKVFLGGSETK